MLITELRPRNFQEVKGNIFVKKALQLIARSPKDKPQSIIFQGSWGSGKTTLSRIFVKALNCEKKDGQVCNSCSSCKELDKGSPLYNEYDCSVVGNVEDLARIKGDFAYSYSSGYKVYVFDEFHLASKQSQASVLKELENPPKDTFFLFVTTDPEKILDTIKSRSLVLDFVGLTDQELRDHLLEVIANKGLSIPDEVINLIVRRSKGHSRDSLSLLEKCMLYGVEDFLASSQVLDKIFKEFLGNLIKKQQMDKALMTDLIGKIITSPVKIIEDDFSHFIKSLSDLAFVKKIAPEVVKDFIFDFLKHKQYLRDDTTWKIFFDYVVDKYSKK